MRNEPDMQHPGPYAGDDEGVHLRDYLNVLRRRWKVAGLVFLLVVAAVVAVTLLMKPVYEASVILKVGGERKGGMLQELGVGAEGGGIETDMEILRSRTIAEQVVRELNLNWQVAEYSPGFTGQLRHFSVEGPAEALFIELLGGDRFRVSDGGGRVLGEGVSDRPVAAAGIALTLHVDRGRTGEWLRLERQPLTEVTEAVMQKVRVAEVGKGTSVLRLAYRDTDPARAREVANTLVRTYQQQSVRSNTREAGMTVEFINEQIEGLKSSLDRTEQDLQEYKVRSGLMTLGPEGESLVEKLVALEQQKNELALKAKRLDLAIADVRGAMEEGGSATPTVFEGLPLTAELVGRLVELEAEKKTLLEDFTAAHPAVVEVRQKMRRSQEALLTAYQGARKDLDLELQDLQQVIADYTRQLESIPEAELELAKRARVNKVNSELYTFLLQKQQEARIAEASTLSNVEIVDPAITPEKPVKPNKKKNLALGLVVGLMAAVGTAFFIEYLDDRVNDAETVRARLGLGVLGVIPRIEAAPEQVGEAGAMLVSRLQPRSPPVEAFRALRTGVAYATAEQQRKVLLVTSSLPGEGKTTVSANLAFVLAQTGAKVLLVGCDLRRPGVHRLFRIPETPGLSDMLALKAGSSVRRIAGTTLDVLGAGTVPPNPSELLGSERMKSFLEQARRHYDYVVLDAPPVLPVTDAQVLAPLADDVVLVLEACRIPLRAAQRTVESLRAVQARLIGVALNDKSGKGSRYYGSYAYYGRPEYGGYYGESTPAAEGGLKNRIVKLLD